MILVVFDIDQTLALDNHRVPKRKCKDMPDFLRKLMNPKKLIKDPPIRESMWILDMISQCFYHDVECHILTNRSEDSRPATEKWLQRYNVPYDDLIMRPKGDVSSSSNYKKNHLNRLIRKYQPDLKLAFNDDWDGRMTETYKDLGFVLYRVTHKLTPDPAKLKRLV